MGNGHLRRPMIFAMHIGLEVTVSSQSLTVNGKREGIYEGDFLEVAKNMNIKKPEEKINKVKSAVHRWEEYADKVLVDSELRDGIKATLLV